ncbi:MAG: hypothetical protein HYV94_20155 [Candidatus Rokubacteria bacterium]|nr:hypothetical protein [Candidatus Rokubacteria bacterium]
MLDTIVINGQVVTPEGAGAWEIGIAGETIAAVAQPGTLPREGARVLDAAGLVVVPGGIDPHPDAIRSGYPSFKVFTTDVLPPHPKRQGNRLDFGRIGYAMEKVVPAGRIST